MKGLRIRLNKLNPEDAALFYDLWFPLLDFVNQKHQVLPADFPGFEALKGKNAIEPATAKKVARVLWGNPSEEIDAYLSSTAAQGLPPEAREIIESWKQSITREFIMVKHTDNGTVLMGGSTEAAKATSYENYAAAGSSVDGSDDRGYYVVGLESSIADMFTGITLPVMVRATLLPFKGVIISDGIIERFPIVMGKTVKKVVNDAYMQAKWERRILSAL